MTDDPLPAEATIKDILAQAPRLCPGITDALLVDAQGVLLDRFSRHGAADPEEIAVEAMAAVPALGRVAAGARIGRPQEWFMTAERGALVLRRLGALELFLVVRVGPDVFLGRARFAARILALRLADLLARS